MALIVEDGTGKTTSEAYISVADATTYLAAYAATSAGVAPTAWTGAASDAVRENALRQGAQWLDRKFAARLKGSKYLATQRLLHPRSGLMIEGFSWDSVTDGLPRSLTEANAEVALLFIGGEVLFDNYDTSGALESETLKLGPMSKTVKYSGSRSEDDVYTKVEAILSELLQDANQVVRG